MELPEELAFERLDPAEKYRRAVPGYMKRLRNVYEAVYERFGEDGLELIREWSRPWSTPWMTRWSTGSAGPYRGGIRFASTFCASGLTMPNWIRRYFRNSR